MLERFSDPVCGVEVNAMNCRGQWEYRGHIYYFCSLEHQRDFEANPEKFIRRDTAVDPAISMPPIQGA